MEQAFLSAGLNNCASGLLRNSPVGLCLVRQAAQRSQRSPADVRLIAVSKTHPAATVIEAARAGQLDFGENRVQEGLAKIDECLPALPAGASWHLIGHLQTNKVRDALELFDVIHSLDRLDLAKELDKRARARGRTVDVLVEVNVAAEVSKGGVAPDGLGDLLDSVAAMSSLKVRGLMAVPPEAKDPDDSRVWFRALRKLGEHYSFSELSMGMSGDFEVAIEEGATMVRVGTAIFGPRTPRPEPGAGER